MQALFSPVTSELSSALEGIRCLGCASGAGWEIKGWMSHVLGEACQLFGQVGDEGDSALDVFLHVREELSEAGLGSCEDHGDVQALK